MTKVLVRIMDSHGLPCQSGGVQTPENVKV